MLKLTETFKTNEKFNASLLKDELNLISSFEGKELELILSRFMPGGPPAASFKSGPNKYGIYLSPDSSLILNSGENGDRVARALLQHEGAHTWLTNFGASEEMVKNLSKKHGMPIQFVKNIENIVEDCRIESVWATVFPGSRRSFTELYKITLDEIKRRHEGESNLGPIDFVEALLIARFGIAGGNILSLEPKIPREVKPYYDKFASELEKVQNTDWKGTYVVTDNILRIFNEIFEHKTPPFPAYSGMKISNDGHNNRAGGTQDSAENGSDQNQGQSKEDKSGGKGKDSKQDASNKENAGEGSSNTSYSKSTDEAGESKPGSGGVGDNNSTAPVSKLLDELTNLLSQLVPTMGDMMGDKSGTPSDKEISNGLSGTEDEILNNSRNEIIKLLKSIPLSKYPTIKKLDQAINKMTDDSHSNDTFEITGHGANGLGVATTYNGLREQYNERIKPNPKIKKMLEELELWNNAQKNLTNSTSGIRLDVRKLIRYGITNDPADISRPYLRRIKNAGAEIWVLLDISSSMDGPKINAAKKILGSIHDSLDGSGYVHLKMFGFYGGNSTHVFELDRKLLMNLAANGSTPTDIAINYITELMKKNKTDFDKTLFIITDGDPNDGYATKSALINLKDAIKNVKIFTIFISRMDEGAAGIFSPSDWYFNVSSMDEVEGVLEEGIKGIVDKIKKQLRK